MAKIYKSMRLSKKAVSAVEAYKKKENKTRKKDEKLNFSTAADELICSTETK